LASLAATSETIACFCSRLRPKVQPPSIVERTATLNQEPPSA
jgi:hypothetical protein